MGGQAVLVEGVYESRTHDSPRASPEFCHRPVKCSRAKKKKMETDTYVYCLSLTSFPLKPRPLRHKCLRNSLLLALALTIFLGHPRVTPPSPSSLPLASQRPRIPLSQAMHSFKKAFLAVIESSSTQFHRGIVFGFNQLHFRTTSESVTYDSTPLLPPSSPHPETKHTTHAERQATTVLNRKDRLK